VINIIQHNFNLARNKMSIIKGFLTTLTCALVSFPTTALSQRNSEDDALKASVLIAVAQSLGADPLNLPDYQAELQVARVVSDTALICGASLGGHFLTPAVANKMILRAVDLVKQKNPSLWERPRYVRDLIVVSAVSFEAGRFAGASKEYRATLAASAPATPECKPVDQ
jgi:hypothetical protein